MSNINKSSRRYNKQPNSPVPRNQYRKKLTEESAWRIADASISPDYIPPSHGERIAKKNADGTARQSVPGAFWGAPPSHMTTRKGMYYGYSHEPKSKGAGKSSGLSWDNVLDRLGRDF
tara:strand:+ start:537 stop:890 length:354 start_codon:yes stop_codon:yes gene_type:complete